MHYNARDQAVHTSIRRQYDTTDEQLGDPDDLVQRCKLDDEEYVFAAVWQRRHRRIVRPQHLLLQQWHDDVIGKRASVGQAKVSHSEEPADLRVLYHDLPVGFAARDFVIVLHDLEAVTDRLLVDDQRPELDHSQAAEDLRSYDLHQLAQILGFEVRPG